jgi:phospholipase C
MKMTDRRTFLKMMGIPAAAAALPLDLAQALAIPAYNHHGSIQDVEHIVFLMQENRSFDHYFGTMRGVRGFADPFVAKLPSGKPVWNQPNGATDLLPFRPNVEDLGETFLPDPPHGWSDTHAAWNAGRYDRWVPNKGVTTMTYHTRRDLPYQYALADAFTICDHYHCSLLGPTDPNRYHMWTGWVGNDGNGGGPVITNAEAGYDWSTYPERLQRAGISWKVYQDSGVGLDAAGFWGWTGDPYIGNYGDNSLLYFHQYQFAAPGTPLADRAKTGTTINAQNRQPEHLMDNFREDVLRGRLPKVSWIVAPEAYTEHPNWVPDVGGWYVSQVIDALTKNPDVWSKTVLFITYDEEGGFFDHLVPPTPPQTRAQGLSTVAITNEIFPGDAGHASGPYGLGIRVPMIVISPWSRGGWVNSQLFDHTSMIRFLEARFADDHPDLIESNITPWRRAVVGDLTTAFDFKTPNASRRLILPSTADARPDLERHPDEVPVPPAHGVLPQQEHGVKPARALPYTLLSHGAVEGGAFNLHFHNKGRAGVVFQVRSGSDAPRGYTVEPHKRLEDTWSAPAGGADFDLSVLGPNGFFRGFKARSAAGRHTANLLVRERYDEQDNEITLEIANRSGYAVIASVLDNYTGHRTQVKLSPGDTDTKRWSLKRSSGWYDFVITAADDAQFELRIAGHLETGEDSITDPAMGGLV